LRLPLTSRQTGAVTRLALLGLLPLAFAAGAADARRDDHGGRGGNEDVSVAGDCGLGAASSLRLRARGAEIEIRFRLRQTGRRGVWRIVLVHEHRVSARAISRTMRGDDSFELRWTVKDLGGSDTIVVHAGGPSGLVCRATAALPDGP
jgi:hypothetical protein